MGDNFNVKIINTFEDSKKTINVNSNTSVLRLKIEYSKVANLKNINYVLIFEGTVLKTIDETSGELKKLSDYNITRKNKIHYVGKKMFEPYSMGKNYGETAISGGDIKNLEKKGNKQGARKKRKKRKKTKRKSRKEVKR